MTRCEDYPCCGHTNDDPCSREWYDEPDAFDTTVNPHALCDHEFGDCEVDFYDEEDEEDEWADDAYAAEDAWLDGSYEE